MTYHHYGTDFDVNAMTPSEVAKELRERGMGCNCDLDNWQPEQSTGHSWVCRIHKQAMRMKGFNT